MCHTEQKFCQNSGRGLIQLLILRIIHEKPVHGYQLIEELGHLTMNTYIPKSGTIYTMLRRMEQNKLLVSEWLAQESSFDRRIYKITDNGIKTLEIGIEILKSRKTVIDNLIQYYNAHFHESKTTTVDD